MFFKYNKLYQIKQRTVANSFGKQNRFATSIFIPTNDIVVFIDSTPEEEILIFWYPKLIMKIEIPFMFMDDVHIKNYFDEID